MKFFKQAGIAIGAFFVLSMPAFAASSTSLLDVKPIIAGEKEGFMSSDPVLFNQLVTKNDAKPQALWGFLSLPKAQGNKKFPAVIMMSGSGGLHSWTSKYVRQLNEAGVATFQVDSYTPRGLAESIADQSQLPVPMMVADAYAAMRFLAKEPNIDSHRIAIMGWSLGGLVSIITAFEDANAEQLGHAPRFAAHISLYPACNIDFPDTKLDGSPWLYLHGSADDYTQMTDCLPLLKAASNTVLVKAVLYPNAYHAFDAPDPVRWLASAQNPKNCRGRLNNDWVATEEKTGIVIKSQEDFQRAYAGCMLAGAHLGFNKQASDDALYEVTSFVRHYLVEQKE